MKSIKFYILGFVIYFINTSQLYAMLSKFNPATLKRVTAVKRVAQKRGIYNPSKLKGLYTPLTNEAKKVSPMHGAIEFETGIIQKKYEVESQAFGPQLVQELFFKQGPQFKPTSSKAKAAYALSPEILGLVIGALETGRLQEEKVRNYIIDQWQNEYRKITDEKKLFSRGKIEKLLTLIENEYKNDKDSCCRILLGFLYAKALPDNDHDMIHYLAGLNEFMNVFTDQSSLAAKSVITYTAQKKGIPQPEPTLQPEPTFFEKLQSGAKAIKNYVLGSPDASGSSSNVYTQKDYDILKEALQITGRPKAVKKAITNDFELTVSAMLDERKNTSSYPPKVVQSSYGYEGKTPAPNCVEAAIQDLLNIILYNQQSKSFDLSLLPSTLSLNEKFKQFYTAYNSSDINTASCGQAFMDLVSGIDGIKYKRGDYEFAAGESENNLLTLMNYFFGISAQNLIELGEKLSDEQRTITFLGPIQGKESMEITITVKDNQTNKSQQAIFCFRSGHGWLEVPQRDLQGIKKSLFTPAELVQNYRINPEVQPLLRIEPIGFASLTENVMLSPEELPKAFYYTLPVETDYEKNRAIYSIAGRAKNIDREAFDYAFHLYQQLPSYEQTDLLLEMFKIAKKAKVKWESHVKFKKIVADNYRHALKLVRSKGSSQEYIDFIKELYEGLPDELSKYKFIMDALDIIINTKILDTDFVKKLYEQIVNNEYKKKFLADFLLTFAKYPGWAKKVDCVAIAEQCIRDGADIIGSAIHTDPGYSTVPLASALRMDSLSLVELLISHGIPINEPLKYKDSLSEYYHTYYRNITPLGIAVSKGNDKIVEFLLKNGAYPNSECNSGVITVTYPIFMAVNRLDKNIFNLLLQYGADVNIHNSNLDTPLDSFNKETEAYKQGIMGAIEKELRNILLNAGAKTSAQLLEEQIKTSNAVNNQELLSRE